MTDHAQLTREQVEEHINERCVNHYPHIKVKAELLATDAALRATITQQAQELERVKEDLDSSRTQVSTLQASDRAYAAASADNVQQRLLLADQLAAMTTERDEARVVMDADKRVLDSHLDHINRLTQQLAASQARCREMEKKQDELVAILIANKVQVQTVQQNRDLRAQVAQLQATLAAREARIEELLDGRYKAALYDLIIDLSRIELSEMSALGRAAWDRLVKGGWYADDLEKLLMQASAAQQIRGRSGGAANHGAGT